LDDAPSEVLQRGWQLGQEAVRRKLNAATHDLATAASRWARYRRERGTLDEQMHAAWGNAQGHAQKGLRLPAWSYMFSAVRVSGTPHAHCNPTTIICAAYHLAQAAARRNFTTQAMQFSAPAQAPRTTAL